MFVSMGAAFGGLFPPSLHQRLVTFHAKDALRRPGILEVFNLFLAISAPKAGGTKGLIAGENGKIFDFVPTGTAAVGTIVANEGAVAQEEEVGVRIEEGVTGVAAEAVDMPSIAGCNPGQCRDDSKCTAEKGLPSSNALPSSRI